MYRNRRTLDSRRPRASRVRVGESRRRVYSTESTQKAGAAISVGSALGCARMLGCTRGLLPVRDRAQGGVETGTYAHFGLQPQHRLCQHEQRHRMLNRGGSRAHQETLSDGSESDDRRFSLPLLNSPSPLHALPLSLPPHSVAAAHRTTSDGSNLFESSDPLGPSTGLRRCWRPRVWARHRRPTGSVPDT